MSSENEKLSLNQLKDVTGGVLAAATKDRYVNATCGYCGDKGPHRMDTGWTAICRKCGRTINLKAQGGE